MFTKLEVRMWPHLGQLALLGENVWGWSLFAGFVLHIIIKAIEYASSQRHVLLAGAPATTCAE